MLIDALLNYISEENTDYALMVTGEWGSGKSYFIASEFKDALKNKFKETKFINVSLNGLQSLEEIYPKILAEVINYTGKGGRITFGLAKVLLDLDIEIPKIGLKSKTIANALKNSSLLVSKETSFPDSVLCFDDLERISKGIPMESVLGFIHSNFIEQKKMKVILICDESKIKSPDYKEIKEKIVARTYLYKTDVPSLLSKLVQAVSKNELFAEAINNESNMLIHFFEKYEVRNLRTVKFILNIIRIVVLGKPGMPKELIHKIMYFILCYSNEYKLGAFLNNAKPELRNFQEYFLIKTLEGKNGRSEDNVKSYSEKFYEKYVNFNDSNYLYVDTIADLILDGFLDIDKLTTEIAVHYPDSKPKNMLTLDRVVRFRDLSESEFQEVVTEVLNYLDNNEYSVDQFLQASYFMLKFHNEGLLSTNPNSIIIKSKNELLKKIQSENISAFDLMERFEIYMMKDKPEVLRKTSLELKNAINKKKQLEHEAEAKRFFLLLFSGEEVAAFKKYDSLKHDNALVLVLAGAVDEFILKASNKGLNLFSQLLRIRYIQYQSIKAIYLGEKGAFESILKYFRSKCDIETEVLRKYILSEIVSKIEIILSLLE